MADTSTSMPYREARERAETIRSTLAPHCVQIEIAGSIRRHKPRVGDIEIVCQPRPEVDLLGQPEPFHTAGFVAAVRGIGAIVKGQPQNGRYIQVRTADGVQVDVFCARAENWGLILAIRTGSAEFSHRVLAIRWVRMGYRGDGGNLYRDGRAVTIPTEAELFRLIDLKYVPPEERNL